MLVVMVIGFGASMTLLSPMQEPAINMALTSMGRNLGFASQQRQPFAAFKQPTLHNSISAKAIDPMIARSGYTRPVMVRAESSLIQQLDEAIKIAQTCNGDCKVEWDNVEELSAAVAHAEPKALKSETLQFADEGDLESFKASMAKLADARKKMSEDKAANRSEMDPKLLGEITAALSEKQEIVSKVGTDRLARFEAKIQEAIATATASKSPVDWDIVEELMQERSHLKKFGGSA